MPKVKFTAFATKSDTGESGYGSGEMTVPNYIPRQNHSEAVRQNLQSQGYKDIHIDNLTSEA
jgi:hypothetical protein